MPVSEASIVNIATLPAFIVGVALQSDCFIVIEVKSTNVVE